MKLIRKFNGALQRFLYKHPNFGLRHLMTYLIVGNLLVYLLSMMDRTGMLAWYLCLIPGRVLRGEIWRLVTFVFVPGTYSLLSLALELYFYYLIGSTLEQVWGEGKFTAYYLCGMLLSIVYAFLAGLIVGMDVIVSGSYISLSMFFVYATLWPENRVLLFFILPIKIKWLAWFEAAVFACNMIWGLTLLPLVGILNYFLFCGDKLADSLRFPKARGTAAASRTRFRRSVSHAEQANSNLHYLHRCAVCGKTDTEHPELEFRFCSQCVGYHCFCSDHIHSHIHFTEP